MTVFERHYRQDATYWSAGGVDDSGDPTWGAATAVRVRWEDKITVSTNASGEEMMTTSQVFIKIDMEIGGFLFLGTSVVADPTTLDGAKEIQAFFKIPRLRNNGFERRALL